MFGFCACSKPCELLADGMLRGIPTHTRKQRLRFASCGLSWTYPSIHPIHPSIHPSTLLPYLYRKKFEKFGLTVLLILGGIHWASSTWQRMLCPRQWVGYQVTVTFVLSWKLRRCKSATAWHYENLVNYLLLSGRTHDKQITTTWWQNSNTNPKSQTWMTRNDSNMAK